MIGEVGRDGSYADVPLRLMRSIEMTSSASVFLFGRVIESAIFHYRLTYGFILDGLRVSN